MSAFRKSVASGAAAAGQAIRYGWKIGPAVCGMAAVSVGTGGIIQVSTGVPLIGLFCGLVVGGCFAIAIDLKG